MTPAQNPAPRPWRLAENHYGFVKQQRYEVAVLPLGATEPHNLHLPYGTDVFEGEAIADRAAERATAAGASVVVLPAIPFGTETNMRQFPLAINLNPSTLHRVITDIVQSLVQSGIRKIVLVNSHGGNDFKPLLRELYGQIDAHLFLYNWYQAVADAAPRIFEHPDDHAGEMETSAILALRPELVARGPQGEFLADDGAKRRCQLEAVERGWVAISRPWHLLTTNSGAGYPHAATADKGRQILDLAAQRLGDFLVELAHAVVAAEFPYQTQPPQANF